MKIFIIGLPASGKTTLARTISAELGIPLLELDALFGPEIKGAAQRLVFEDIEDELNSWLAREDWIIEGVYPIEEIVEQADEIVYLRGSALKCVVRQWRRFAMDEEQRRKYGLWRNVGLSFFIVSLSMGRWGVRISHSGRRFALPSSELLQLKYGDKVKVQYG